MSLKIFKVYYNGEPIETRYSDGLVKTIIGSGLKQGDKLIIRPFNHYNDENTRYKSEVMEYHNITLIIEEINFEIIETWNGDAKTNIDVFLVNYERNIY